MLALAHRFVGTHLPRASMQMSPISTSMHVRSLQRLAVEPLKAGTAGECNWIRTAD